ncbi:hypothetical protein [Virgibacillus profundi]|nr:hypothetical protein [Virgibacillus profundi]
MEYALHQLISEVEKWNEELIQSKILVPRGFVNSLVEYKNRMWATNE